MGKLRIMPEPRIFVTRAIPRDGLDVLAAGGARVEIGTSREDEGLPRAALLDAVRRCDALLCLLTDRVDREVFEANPRLRGVANMAVGFDNVDVAAATALGIPVSNTPGVLTETTADFAWALLLAVARRVPEADRYVREGRFRIWGPNLLLGGDVHGKTLGIVGYGRIGRAVARRARGFSMRVLACDPAGTDDLAEPCDLDRLLAESDFVTLHAALTDSTRGLIGARELAAMKPTAYLVNTARGPLVDEAALVRALRDRTIAGAALDVFEREPELAEGLRELDSVVLAPHVASASRETRGAMARIAAENALAHVRGERAPDAVNPEVYAR